MNRWSVSLKVNSKFLNLLGIARRANKLSFGHDAVTDSVKTGNAVFTVLSSDASERLKEEIKTLCEKNKTECAETDFTMEQLGISTGMKKIAVLSVNDNGFAESLEKLIREE